ncbi:hypothetical protein M2347_001159 [Chryseobacterium sp. H1D6B]|nr:hypothetical protein [Chryseobacterium sp. H1D6B]MDH6251432.1 hypothetical protein [Chryseobacterium sp. H1D6B]
MKNLNEKLAAFSIEKLEERKEFTCYCCPKPCTTQTPCGGGTGGGGTKP